VIAGSAAVWPLAAGAQQAAKVPRIGLLGLGSASAWAARLEPLRAGLRELGYIHHHRVPVSGTGSSSCASLPRTL